MAVAPFDKRLGKIVRNHQRMSHGVAHSVGKDGLITARPRTYNPKFPLKGLVLLIAAAFLFKAYIHASLGAADYNSRLEPLADGTLFEKAGAWVMQADTVTLMVSSVLQGLGI